jgi:hypothetical protein
LESPNPDLEKHNEVQVDFSMIIRKVTYFLFHFCLDAKVEQKVKAEDSWHKNNFIYATFIQTRTQIYSLYS